MLLIVPIAPTRTLQGGEFLTSVGRALHIVPEESECRELHRRGGKGTLLRRCCQE